MNKFEKFEKCDSCGEYKTDSDSCHSSFPHDPEVERIPYGKENKERCNKCGVAPGGYHHLDCPNEECPTCGGHYYTCPCGDEDEPQAQSEDDPQEQSEGEPKNESTEAKLEAIVSVLSLKDVVDLLQYAQQLRDLRYLSHCPITSDVWKKLTPWQRKKLYWRVRWFSFLNNLRKLTYA